MRRQFGSRSGKGPPGPCEWAAKLDEQCRSGDPRSFLSNVLHIPPQSHSGNDTSNPCRCGPISYGLAVACAKCQSKEVPKWDTWTAGCKKPLEIRLPPPVADVLKFPVDVLADVSRLGHTSLPNIFCGHGHDSSTSSASSTSSSSTLTTSVPHHSSTDIAASSTLTSSPTLSTDTFSSANISSTDVGSIPATSLDATTTTSLLSSTTSTPVPVNTTTTSRSQTSTNETSSSTSDTSTATLITDTSTFTTVSSATSHSTATTSDSTTMSAFHSRIPTAGNTPTFTSQHTSHFESQSHSQNVASRSRTPTVAANPITMTPFGIAHNATITTPPPGNTIGALDVSAHSSKSSAASEVVSSSSSSWWSTTSSSTSTVASSSVHKTGSSSFRSSNHISTLSSTLSQPRNIFPATGHSHLTSMDPTPTPTPTPTPSSSGVPLPSTGDTIKTQWMIAGSVLGVVFAGSIVVGVLLLFRWKRRKQQYAASVRYSRMFNSSGMVGGYGSLEGGGDASGRRAGMDEMRSLSERMATEKRDLDLEHLMSGRSATPQTSQVDLAGETTALKSGAEGGVKGGAVGEAFTTSRNITAASLPPRLSIPESYYNPDSEPCSPAAESSINMYMSPTSTVDDQHTDSNHSSSSPPSAGSSSLHRRRHSSIFGGALRPLPSVPESSSRA